MQKEFRLLINGSMYEGSQTFTVIDPSTEKPFAIAPSTDNQLIDTVVNYAEDAFIKWSKFSQERRNECLLKAAEILRDNVDELSPLLSREQGKSLSKANWEIKFSAFWIEKSVEYFSVENEVVEEDICNIKIDYVPYGVVAGIIPWNLPVLLAVWKMANPLLAGNTLILKPSPYTPLTLLKVGELFRQVFPPGVLNIIAGGDETGEALICHDRISFVSFTGSVPVGKKIGALAGERLKPAILELGGNDPAIVLENFEFEKHVKDLFWGCFANTGQSCTAIKRLFVQESIFDKTVNELVKLVELTKIGSWQEPEVEIGPLNNARQLSKIMEIVDDALLKGGELRCGGSILNRKGYFYKPTIITGVPSSARLIMEEQFGPVVPIIPFRELDEVVRLANNSKYALGASVWTSDYSLGKELLSHIDSQTNWINWHGPVFFSAPFGNWKNSGLAYEHGKLGVLSCLQPKVVLTRN